MAAKSSRKRKCVSQQIISHMPLATTIATTTTTTTTTTCPQTLNYN
jgi:hypothetical protein